MTKPAARDCRMRQETQLSPRTARCVVSVEILPVAMQQCRTTCTTSPEQIEVMKLEGLTVGRCVIHSALNHDAIESLPFSYRCHKQTDHGRCWISPVYRRLAVAKFSKSTM